MQTIDRLHGFAIKRADELTLGDRVAVADIIGWERGGVPKTNPIFATIISLKLVGDDVIYRIAERRGEHSTSIGNRYIVAIPDNQRNPL